MITVKAPTRIDLAGGTLDIWPLSVLFAPSASINAAIDLNASIEARRTKGRGVVIKNANTGEAVKYSPKTAENKKSLFDRALDFAPVNGWEFSATSSVPPGSGLGGSSSMLIAFLRILDEIRGCGTSDGDVLEVAKNIEARHLGIPTGAQDYVAALNGGVNALIHAKEGSEHRRLKVNPEELQSRVVLAYSGVSRVSGAPNWLMLKKAVEKDAKTVRAFEKIAANSLEILSALANGRYSRVGGLVDAESAQRGLLGRGVITPLLKTAFAVAAKNGGHPKVCGAGGGGCFIVWCEPSRKGLITSALVESGLRTLDFKVAPAARKPA